MNVATNVPYEAGLGINDVLGCSGPGYTIADLSDPPHGISFKVPNDFGAFVYSPDFGYTGPDTFTYTLYQGAEVADQAEVHINVTDGCAAIAFADVYTTPFETPLAEAAPGLLDNDTLVCQPNVATLSSPPSHGDVMVAGDGSFQYTPDAGFWGNDTFAYDVLDASQAVIATSIATVVVDKPPCVAVDDAYSTTVDTPLTVGAPGVLGNDFQCPDFTGLQVDQAPTDGTVTLQADGSFTYTPNPGFVGQDTFTYDHVGFDIITFDDIVLANATVVIDVTATPATTEPGGATTEPGDTTTTTATTQPATPTTQAGVTTTTAPGAATTTPATAPTTAPSTAPEVPPTSAPISVLRVATFDAALSRSTAGELATDLATPDDQQAANVAAIIQRTRPDVLLLTDIDVDSAAAIDEFRANYLLLSQNGAQPIDYPHVFVAPSNTGVPSGFDLDNDGTVGGANDALGYGDFPGQHGMVLLSRFPIATNQVRTFQHLLWASVPGARLPDDPATPDPADWYSADELAVLPLSSTSHWDVPINVFGRLVHVLASRPAAPTGDGPEDRNGMRNADEIGFWADYVAGTDTDWIVDDAGGTGGLAPATAFVIAGDLSSDPTDGDSVAGAVDQVLALDQVQDPAPASEGAVEAAVAQGLANRTQAGDPALDTADLDDDTLGNLRTDYVLPYDGFDVVDAGVFWPSRDDELARLVTLQPLASSDHRLVWVDLG